MKKNIYLVCLLFFLMACESAKDKADRFFVKGNLALSEGRNDEAIRLYDEAIAKNPMLKEAYNNKGVAQYREGKFTEAVVTYSQVMIEVDPNYIDARRNRLDAFIETNNHDGALGDLKFLSSVYPDSAFVLFKRGEVFMKTREYRSSVVAFIQSYRLDSSRVDALVNAAIGYYKNGLPDRAHRMLNQAVLTDPSESNIYNTLAMLAIDNDDYKEAMDQLNKAIELDPKNFFYYNNRGYIHTINGDLKAAEEDINKGIIGAPQNAWAYRNRGFLMNKKGDYEAAIRNFELAIKYEPSEELKKVHAYYGNALFKLGRNEEACVEWQISFDRFENEARKSIELYCK